MTDSWQGEPRQADPVVEKAADKIDYHLERTEWATIAEKMQGATPADLYAIFGGWPVEP